ncbi:cation/calcium exchanger 1 [Rhodamnia argentea]|uniref:Cation/calcium exchanger 1 n=1 Tax=Rhodamnia argentea TaxID=178133 RepID=A0A8B8N4P7_9MYRT|nr:cation/calcium exchanger 1 [Rhodamnia argentea]
MALPTRLATTSRHHHPGKLSIFLNTSFLFLISFFLVIQFRFHLAPDGESPPAASRPRRLLRDLTSDGCARIHDYADYKAKCVYVKSHDSCRHKGYINYLQIFYCTCGEFPLLGHVLLLLWLAVLFYLLGNTAACYFCPSLEGLSRILKLSPTIAGVTLLSLGNGAPDVFASIVSFTRTGDGDVGLNTILGGAFFVSSVVVGTISILICPDHEITVDKPSFIRDVLFFVFSLSSLLVIIAIGRVGFWSSILFVSIYLVYVCTVCFMQLYYQKRRNKHFSASVISNSSSAQSDDLVEMGIPMLGYVDDEKSVLVENGGQRDEDEFSCHFLIPDSPTCSHLTKLLQVLELPLQLPRKLTIPVVDEERWSKPYAIISVTLAPILLSALCNSQRDNVKFRSSTVTYLAAGLIGLVLGNLAFVTTKKSNPPKKCLFPWLAAGFLMSITWTYIIAEELVSLLVSVGIVFGVSPSILGLTVLAWGNSLGDLIANVAMAMNGGADGVQIAISGCYAGPMFNTLMGLGLPLVFQSWSEYPDSYEIPGDNSLYETLGFLISGLLWALVVVPRKNMRLDRFLGWGLLAIYSCFLFLRLAKIPGPL